MTFDNSIEVFMKLIRIKEVQELTGISKPYIYALANKGLFPKPVKLSARSSAWVSTEVLEWIENRIVERDSQISSQ